MSILFYRSHWTVKTSPKIHSSACQCHVREEKHSPTVYIFLHINENTDKRMESTSFSCFRMAVNLLFRNFNQSVMSTQI